MGYLPDIARALDQAGADLRPGDRVLDVGCGTQPYRSRFPQASFVGIDVEVSGRSADAKQPDVYFDGLHIPFANDEFGLVMCIEVLEHAIEPTVLLSEMQRVLRPGGRLVLSTPFMWGEHEAPFDFRRYSANGLRRVVEQAGFRVERQEKMVVGRHAINALLRGEIKAARGRKLGRTKLSAQLLQGIDLPLQLVWSGLLRYWEKVYGFDRVYVRSMLVAHKPPAQPE